jgi:spermidine synthase
LVIMDAFEGAKVPAELVTREWFALVSRVLRPQGTFVGNLTDKAPFAWSRRVVAGIRELCPTTAFAAEPAVIKGRRFGNLVVSSGPALNVPALERVASRATFPYRIISGPALANWLGKAHPFTDADTQASPPPEDFGVTTLTRHKE